LNHSSLENQKLKDDLEKANEQETEMNIDPLLKKIQSLEKKLEVQTSCVLKMGDKYKKLEKEKISLDFKIDQSTGEFERKIAELTNHNEVLAQSNQELKSKLSIMTRNVQTNPATTELEKKVQNLESKLTVSE
jgi:chromosome segregation ATPase